MEDILTITDITQLKPELKNLRIVEQFDLLQPGQAFIIQNDQDPKPLFYQLIADSGNVFSWEYLENGPEVWRVMIARLFAARQETIGEIVTKDYRKAQIFKKLGIDFCCGGKKTLDEVCTSKGLDIEAVKKELLTNQPSDGASFPPFDKWDIGFLSDYIINTHHTYVKENIPFILELANKVAKVHGDSHQELTQVAEIFGRIASDLSSHLVKEESTLFPYIKELAVAAKNDMPIAGASFGTINNPTQMMEMEHEQAGEDMAAIRRATNDYTLPADACTSYTILFKKLQEFENDLFNHVHLENNILFPKAIQLEIDLLKAS